MEITLTEKLIGDLKVTHSLRTFFDSGSDESTLLSNQEKLETMAKAIYLNYDLNKIVEDYRMNYNPKYDHYILENINPSIKELISFLNSGIIYDSKTLNSLENTKRYDLIKLLENKIREKVLPFFTIDNLIRSYVEYKFEQKNENYNKQTLFFNIDFDKDMTSEIKKRDIVEKIDHPHSYRHLYDYLNRFLFIDYYENRITHYFPDMGMAKNQIQLIKKFYPQEDHSKLDSEKGFRKQRILEFTKAVVEILYFNKPL
jgi:hypothetical protein